jgi:endonuclease/exonuclease/phosphatase family metal-dependent hydrolase
MRRLTALLLVSALSRSLVGCGDSRGAHLGPETRGDGGAPDAQLQPELDAGSREVSPPPCIDGRFDDWSEAHLLATDAEGDGTGAFDLSRVYAQSRGSELYLRFDVGVVQNLLAGAPSDGTLQLLLDLAGAGHLAIDFRKRTVTVHDGAESALRWHDVRFLSGPSFGASEFELRIDLARFGIGPGSTIGIDFAGSDALDAPASFAFATPSPEPLRRPAARAAGTRFRIANLNTLFSGLTKIGLQGQRLGRLVRAAGADIYAFQEEYESSADQLSTRLSALDPRGDGASWNVHKVTDNVIASSSPVHAVPSGDDFHAAAVVEVGGPGASVLVLSIHPSCCGYVGSAEDETRVGQMEAVVSTVSTFRAGGFGDALAAFKNAPVIVLGDWNLVGSRTPLTMLERQLGLVHLKVPQLVGEQITTWRDDRSSFPPGLLDLVAHQQELVPGARFVLDTADLLPFELEALKLEAGDSLGSDHLLVVADFD